MTVMAYIIYIIYRGLGCPSKVRFVGSVKVV